MWTETWWGFSEHFSADIDLINTFFANYYLFNPSWFITKVQEFCITIGNLPNYLFFTEITDFLHYFQNNIKSQK